MKIRIKGNSLRYRLTKSDIATLAAEGYLLEQTNFVDQLFGYALKITENTALTAVFLNNIITLFMPKSMLTEMINTEKVGFADKNGALQLLVEKDFTCLDNVEEDQSDNFPNPLALKKD
jgi:hypothetical protein